MSALAPLLERFFLVRLMQQRCVSEHTIGAYRDAWRLLLRFAASRCAKEASALDLAELDADLVGAFLDHLETERGNSVRSRNARLAAVRAFFRFAALETPEHSGTIQRVLALPQKRHERRIVTFLDRPESEALLAAPDRSEPLGRRDHALMLLLVETGLRVSEASALVIGSVTFGIGAHVRCLGKGRKERCTPIGSVAADVLGAWVEERGAAAPEPLFVSRRGTSLSRDAIERLVTKHAAKASSVCESLKSKRVTPHVLRHTTAVALLRGGVDRSIIALWLGHEQLDTTQIYLAADLSIKERALAKVVPHGASPGRYQPDDEVLAFLEAL